MVRETARVSIEKDARLGISDRLKRDTYNNNRHISSVPNFSRLREIELFTRFEKRAFDFLVKKLILFSYKGAYVFL
jgi:hypothetical protein